jgi:DNA-binding response OmpR family regulator
MSFPKNIMVIENEAKAKTYIENLLNKYEVDKTEYYNNATDAIDSIKTNFFDMVLIDINMKGKLGAIDLAKKILTIVSIPIVFINVNLNVTLLNQILSLSPYGFVSKADSEKDISFSLQLAYTNHLQKIEVYKTQAILDSNIVIINKRYKYIKDTMRFYRDDMEVRLSARQLKVIDILCSDINHTVTNDVFMEQIWGDNKVSSSTLRTLIYTIRKLLPDLPIVSYSKVGYSMQSN